MRHDTPQADGVRAGLICPVLVGRERELAALERLLAEARAGRGRTALLAGDAGVGKSRLAGELIARAAAQGAVVLQGRCFEPDRSLPYAPLTDLLRACVGHRPPNEVAAALGPLAPHLVGLLPEHAPLLPSLAVPPALDPQQERQRIAHAFVQFVAHQAAGNPALALVEDLHWSDDASLDVLLTLARRAAGAPLLLLLTYRADEVQPALAALLAALDRGRLAEELRLAPLDYEQADAMLRAIFRQQRPIRGDFLAVLHNLTEGNPFFIEEVLKALVAAGGIYLADGRWDRKPLAELRIPRTVRAALEPRVAALSPAARTTLTVAAVAGRRFDIELLRRVTGAPEPALLAQIKELIAAQLVVEESADVFAFRHALTRAALEAGLLARERAALHAEIFAGLAAMGGARGPEVIDADAADLAAHAFEAGLWPQAHHYARRAADRAQRLYAPHAAIEHLTRAITACARLGMPPPADLLRARAAMRDTVGDADAALADYRAALAAAEQAGDRREQWRVLLDTGFFYSARDYAVMGDFLRRALELARDLSDPALLGQSLNRYGNWHLFGERTYDALRYHHQALAIFEAAGDRAGLATTHDLIGVAMIMAADKLAAVAHYQRAIALFRELGDLASLVSALATFALRGIGYYHIATAPVEDGYAAWVRDGEEALRIARRIGWRAGEANALVYLALIHGASGDYGPALERSLAASELAAEIEHPVWITGGALARGALLLDLLDAEAALPLLDQALALTARLGPFFSRRAAGYLALACVARRDYARAAAVLAPLVEDTTPMETQGQRITWLARAELALAESEPQRALQIAERLIASIGPAAARVPGCVPALWHIQGEALAALGRHDAAEAALRAAADGAERLGLLPARWRSLCSLGRVYQAAGRRTLARSAYAEARAVVELLAGRVPDNALRAAFRRAAAALLPRRSGPPPSAAPPAAAPLTRREREIASLVAQGKTSREIAAALVVGERTVETHISNILGKLGFSSRREIAAWAIDVGLARRVE